MSIDGPGVAHRMGNGRRRIAGFTLIELMITVVIISILATIAYPSYRNTVIKADRSDGRQALMQWAATLERCYSQYFYYKNASPTASAPDCPAPPDSGTTMLSSQGLYTITVTRDATSFTLRAIPASGKMTANDTKCTRLTLDNRGNKGFVGTGPLTECWGAS